jgi:hypothetical protein
VFVAILSSFARISNVCGVMNPDDEALDRVGEAVLLVGRRHTPCRAMHFATALAHRDRQSRVREHQDVVRHVSDRGDLLGRDSVERGQELILATSSVSPSRLATRVGSN